MQYLFAILLPSLFVLWHRGASQALVNVLGCVLAIPLAFAGGVGIILWGLCVLHAWFAIAGGQREAREKKQREKEMDLLAAKIVAAQSGQTAGKRR